MYYRTASNEAPVGAFIEEQEPEAKAKIEGAMEQLEAVNVRLGPPQVQEVAGWGFRELRAEVEETIYRVFHFPFRERKYVLVHAVQQRQNQPTPKGELNTAQERMNDYIARA